MSIEYALKNLQEAETHLIQMQGMVLEDQHYLGILNLLYIVQNRMEMSEQFLVMQYIRLCFENKIQDQNESIEELMKIVKLALN
ncbi:hypothetical protein RZN22_13180 [Bacillaceae bacterium S4-13-58]